MSYIKYTAAVGFWVDGAAVLNVLSDNTEETLTNGVAINDESPANLDLTVIGSLTKTSATGGSETVGFSNWSAVNYATRDFDPSFDVGTGDFTVSGWYKTGSDGFKTIFHRGSPTSLNEDKGASINVWLDNNGFLRLRLLYAAIGINIPSFLDNTWHHFAFSRLSGTLQAFSDGQLLGFVNASTIDITSTTNDELLYIGRRTSTSATTPFSGGTLAGISFETAGKTPPEIQEIYNYEKTMFKKYSAFSFVGRVYSFDFGSTAHTPKLKVGGTINNTWDMSNRETIVDYEVNAHSVTTLGYERTGAFRRIENFILSTNASQEFIFDLYGSSAFPNDPIKVQRDALSPRFNRIGIDNISASFDMVEI